MSEAIPRSRRTSPWRAPPSTIGRHREADRLLQAVLRPPSVVVVEGEGGVGKSRLLRDLGALLEGRDQRFLSAACVSVGDPFPLGVVMEALRVLAEDPPPPFDNPVVGALAPLLPELAPLLPQPPEHLPDPLARLHLVARAVRAVLSDLGPAVLVLDDFQHADPQTLSVVGALLSDLPPGLAIVLAYRREEVPTASPIPAMVAGVPSSVLREVIALEPLGRAEVRALVATILQREEVPDAFLASVMRSTSGLPFAIEEVLRFLGERGDLDEEEVFDAPPRRFSEVPIASRDSMFDEASAPVRDFVLGRLVHLAAPTRRLLRAASLPEPPIEEVLLREVSGLRPSQFAAAASEALEAGLLEEVGEGRFQFRHGFARAAIHADLPGPEHRRLHVRTAQVLRSEGLRDAGSIAYHFLQGGRRTAWLRFGERAADRAASLGDDEWAAAMLLELLATPEIPRATRVRLAGKLGAAALNGMAHCEAIGALREVVKDPSIRPGVRGSIRVWLSRLLLQAGSVPEFRREAELAARELRRRPAVAAVAQAILGVPVLVHGHVEDHRRALDRVSELLPRVEDPLTRHRLMVDRATIHLLLGDPRGRRSYDEVPKRGRSAEERRQELRLDINAGHAAGYVGDYRWARTLAERAHRFRDDPVFIGLACWVESLDIWSRFAIGEWDGMEDRARETARRYPEVPLAVCHIRVIEGLLVMACRSPADAETILAEAFEEARRLGSAPLMATSSGALAWVRVRLGRDDAALEPVLCALDLLRRKGAWIWGNWLVPSAVPALAVAGRLQEAWELIEEMEAGVAGLRTPGASPNLAMARGLAAQAGGDAGAAVEWLERSERGFADLPTPYAVAWVKEIRGAALADLDRDRAVRTLLDSLAELRRLGAAADANRVARRLRSLGVSVPRPWRGGRRGYGSRLSPREREVARLVADGKTNREIAKALFLSPRTVGHHVSNAMRKVGVSSRAALAVTVAESSGEGGDVPTLQQE